MKTTTNQWQKCEKPADDNWITPPTRQGQIVLWSYMGGDDGVIFCRGKL